jgi:hypothetical protein
MFLLHASTSTRSSSDIYIYIYIHTYIGEKQWQTTPKKLAKDAAYQSHTGRLTGLWFLPKLAQGLNTNNIYKDITIQQNSSKNVRK